MATFGEAKKPADISSDVFEPTVTVSAESSKKDFNVPYKLNVVCTRREFDLTFSSKSSREDTALIVEGKTLFVSRSVLSLVSPVLSAMIEAKYELELHLTGKKYKDVLEFILCFYPNVMKAITRKNVFIVLPLAFEYDVAILRDKCETFLLSDVNENTPLDQIFLCLNKIAGYKMCILQEKCEQLVCGRNYDRVMQTAEKHSLPIDCKVKIKDKEIERLTAKLSDITKEKDNYEQIITMLNVKRLWFPRDARCLQSMVDYRVGYLTHSIYINKCSKLRVNMIAAIPVYDIRWGLSVAETIDGSGVDVEMLGEPMAPCKSWSCRIFARIRLRGRKGFKDYYLSDYHSFSQSTPSNDLLTSLSYDLYNEYGLVDGLGKVYVEVQFLVEKPKF